MVSFSIVEPLHYRIPRQDHWPAGMVNRIVEGDAVETMRALPDECVALAVTSPPYWDTVDYDAPGQIGPGPYGSYIDRLTEVWREATRVLIPNGKLAIVTPIMPISKQVMAEHHTRHLKNIGADIEAAILAGLPALERFSLFVWQKQTTKKMFGSYPYPPNIYEDNTIEFIHVFVKHGAPLTLSSAAKEPSRLSKEEWRNLSMQVWPLYPADVRRSGGHPAPFPPALAQRLILMYTFAGAPGAGFGGDLVLDMFSGSGASCLGAKATGRNYLGIDLNPAYCAIARRRLEHEVLERGEVLLPAPAVRRAATSLPPAEDGAVDAQ